MEVSSGRLTWTKVFLWVGLVMGALWAIGSLVFPEAVHEATAAEGEPFTSSHNGSVMLIGALVLSWTVAVAIALGNPLANRGLVQAIIAFAFVFGIVAIYVDLAVAERTTALVWATNILTLALGAAIWVAYPWGRKAS